MFRFRSSVDGVQLEELRRLDARKMLETECRTLRRQFVALEKDNRKLLYEQDFQRQQLQVVVNEMDAVVNLIGGMKSNGRRMAVSSPDLTILIEQMKAEKNTLLEDRTILLKRNAELEALVAQFAGRLKGDESSGWEQV